MPIRVNYLNSLRQNITTTSNVTVDVGSGGTLSSGSGPVTIRRSGSSGLLAVTIILAVALIFVSYLFYKEKKKGRRHEKRD